MPRDLDAFVSFDDKTLELYEIDPHPRFSPHSEVLGTTVDDIRFKTDKFIQHPSEEQYDDYYSLPSEARPKFSPCSLWTGPLRSSLPYIRVQGRHVSVHLAIWSIHYHEVPPGFVVRPRCSQNNRCVTPSHLALFVPRRGSGKLSCRQISDLKHLVVSTLYLELSLSKDPASFSETAVMRKYTDIFRVSQQTIYYHLRDYTPYHRWLAEKKRLVENPVPVRDLKQTVELQDRFHHEALKQLGERQRLQRQEQERERQARAKRIAAIRGPMDAIRIARERVGDRHRPIDDFPKEEVYPPPIKRPVSL